MVDDAPVTQADGFEPVTVGHDTAVVRRSDRAVMAFGIGPPTGGGDRGLRMAAAVTDLASGVPGAVWLNQVHGRDLVEVGSAPGPSCVGVGDGLVTRSAEVALVVWTADCVPVLMAGRRTVAAVHAGWRGCAAGIVEAAVEHLRIGIGERPDDLEVAIGPAVGPDHYQVGAEVVEVLERRAGSTASWLHPDRRVDLSAFVRGRLESCGIAPTRIERIATCTACDPRTASYRRDGARAGRQWSLVIRRDTLTPRRSDRTAPGGGP